MKTLSLAIVIAAALVGGAVTFHATTGPGPYTCSVPRAYAVVCDTRTGTASSRYSSGSKWVTQTP